MIDYARLTWPEKAALLRTIIEAGDHPPGFKVSFDLAGTTAAERQYLREIGVGPFPDAELRDAR